MALCPHCHDENAAFHLQEHPVLGSEFTYAIVSCANCGAPIGVLERENVNSALVQHEAAIDELSEQITGVEKKVDRILHELSEVQRRLK